MCTCRCPQRLLDDLQIDVQMHCIAWLCEALIYFAPHTLRSANLHVPALVSASLQIEKLGVAFAGVLFTVTVFL